jgi:peroxiredoxin Q/BCP
MSLKLKKRFIIIAVIFIALILTNTLMAQKSKLQVGDTVPNFSLKDQNGHDFLISDFIGKKALVIYFYPKDDTPGCTKEACTFRDEFEDFNDLNAKVIGISSDDVDSHKAFAEKYHLPFTLLADTKKNVQKLFGVPKSIFGLIPGRVTYVINKKGVVIYIFNSLGKAEKHIEEAKKALKN